jgi:energy-coupling factor transporter ATP-binding protein EcfA2
MEWWSIGLLKKGPNGGSLPVQPSAFARMSDTPVLKRLLIVRDERVPFVDLDLTDPETGEALNEVCLIGPNGCGKSALLARLHEVVSGSPRWLESGTGYFLAKYGLDGEDLYWVRSFEGGPGQLYRSTIEKSDPWAQLAGDAPSFEDLLATFADDLILGATPGFAGAVSLWLGESRNEVDGKPAPDLEGFSREILQERREAFHRFLRQPENREKTIAEVEDAFESESPHARPILREAWNSLLAPANLRIDFAREEGPLLAPGGETVPVSRLGDALARLLMQTGLAATFDADWLFVDTPETGLHPSLVRQLMPMFRSLPGSRSSRRILATHSAEVAAAFPPASRLRLVPGPGGALRVERGLAPEGAGAEDLLRSDFGLAGPEAPAKPKPVRDERPGRLKRAIRESENEGELADLIDEVISFRGDG